MIDYPKGSEWGKWDLQVQTILDDGYVSLDTYYQALKAENADKWNEYVAKVGGETNALQYDSKTYFTDTRIAKNDRCINYVRNFHAFLEVYNPSLKCVALTDHNYDDTLLLDTFLKYNETSNCKVIAGTEINVGGIHLLTLFKGILYSKPTFSEGLHSFLHDIDVHNRKENGVLTVTQKSLLEVADIVDKNQGVLIYPHCNSNNGLFQERNSTDRTNLADIFNYKRFNILQGKNSKSCNETETYIRSNNKLVSKYCFVLGSDSRSLKDIGSPDDEGNYLWVKANSDFNGLKQIVNEPVDRVFIGDVPPKLLDVEQNKSRYIKSIKLAPVNNAQVPAWFDNELDLNPGLIAIIGKKGSGKSALADTIALAGKSHTDPDDYSFLHKDKFRKKNLAREYEAGITWTNGSPTKVNLEQNVEVNTEVEKVKYLPQKFVETICNQAGVSDKFQTEIDKVIFSYVPTSNRLGASDLSELIELQTNAINSSIASIRQKLSGKNKEIVDLEKKAKPDYLTQLGKKLEAKRKERNDLTPPAKVSPPTKQIDHATADLMSRLNSEITTLESQIVSSESNLTTINEKLNKAKAIELRLKSVEKGVENIKAELSADFTTLGISFDSVLNLTINTTPLTTIQDKLAKAKEIEEVRLNLKKAENELLDENGNRVENLVLKEQQLKKQLRDIQSKLDQESRTYNQYLQNKKEYDVQILAIDGTDSDTSLNTIKSLDKEINYVQTQLPTDATQLYEDRKSITKEIYLAIKSKTDFYKDIYRPLIEFIQSVKSKKGNEANVLDFDAGLVFDKKTFPLQFLNFIHHSKDGSFQGRKEGLNRLQEIIQKYDFASDANTTVFIDELLDNLLSHKGNNPPTSNDIDKQLMNLAEKQKFYDFIFGLEYLDVKYKVLFDKKDLNENEFSPGEKGALLLIFYLLIDQDKIPLIIDQPEENLDNESVFELLVPYIKIAKSKRQVILVTHNPNLAVVCDADQVVCAEMNKETNEIRYISGAIEDETMNKKIVDILEGTLPAFQTRDSKYFKPSF